MIVGLTSPISHVLNPLDSPEVLPAASTLIVGEICERNWIVTVLVGIAARTVASGDEIGLGLVEVAMVVPYHSVYHRIDSQEQHG